MVDPVNMTFELQCIPCDTGWFQPGFTSSSWFSRLPDHCGYQHKISKNISHNLVLYEQGTAIQETRWYCDIQNGFYEENGNMFCDDLSRKTCNCVHKFCQRGYLLRPGKYYMTACAHLLVISKLTLAVKLTR